MVHRLVCLAFFFLFESNAHYIYTKNLHFSLDARPQFRELVSIDNATFRKKIQLSNTPIPSGSKW